MEERGLTQLAFVGELNRQYLTRYHQKDVSRWLNTGNRTSSGEIGFPKYETMAMIADFFDVDVGYLTGETDRRTFTLDRVCDYVGLDAASVEAVRHWIGGTSDSDGGTVRRYRADTLDRFLSSREFTELASKLTTLHEMSTIWNEDPGKFGMLMDSLAADSELPVGFTLELIVGAFYGMASESFSRLVREAYPAPTRLDGGGVPGPDSERG
ncbi:XRE family transcriptional regulator [Bifidobacterium sp. CP2]|uniref:XRE family transcriptional regulator n=1 Tax=Bifidobacterium TaxID=1678 RepID=UPI001BDC8F38|nr:MULTISPECIES: XRE family transcriptional regulator [Bifidobacterium]MBT1181011.1 XRE family transcriptional regulator [Bifidobacterium sp. CP2]MBW3080881.1 XRE family transcriptional regulator [Bifidobacterium saguinibicoloris]